MMQFSLNEIDNSKSVLDVVDKQTTSNDIHDLMKTHNIGYLEAVVWWMEEHNIPESQYLRFIPETIIENVIEEAKDENMLKPSIMKLNNAANVDFLFE